MKLLSSWNSFQNKHSCVNLIFCLQFLVRLQSPTFSFKIKERKKGVTQTTQRHGESNCSKRWTIIFKNKIIYKKRRQQLKLEVKYFHFLIWAFVASRNVLPRFTFPLIPISLQLKDRRCLRFPCCEARGNHRSTATASTKNTLSNFVRKWNDESSNVFKIDKMQKIMTPWRWKFHDLHTQVPSHGTVVYEISSCTW